MIKLLTSKDKKTILDFCYQAEHENLFVIGSFELNEKPFEDNKYWGYFEGEELVGLAVYFGRFGNFVVNAKEEQIIEDFVDYVMKNKIKIKAVAAYHKYADPVLKKLKKDYKLTPDKHYSPETVFVLKKNELKSFAKGEEEYLYENCNHSFVLRKKGKIISSAYIHGISKNYFQVGGVQTLEEYRNKGYAKQVVSALCHYYFSKGKKYALLFVANKNEPALTAYKSLGFKPIDKFIVSEF